jgi:hypothetical protein
MITRKALIAKLKGMDGDTVLVPSTYRSYTNNGSREASAVLALTKILDLPAVGQNNHCGKRGKVAKNPVWLVKLFTEITWSMGAVHVGNVLQHLAA